jgi:hypothetical protein
MERLRSLPPDSSEAVTARQDLLAILLNLSLEIDSVVAQIVEERTHVDEVWHFLERRQNRAVLATQAGAIVLGAGLGVVASSTQFSNDTIVRTGQGFAVGASVLALGFGIAGLVVGHRGGAPIEVQLTMLAPILGRTPAPGSEYPSNVWACMESWRKELVSEWIRVGRISPDSKSKAAQRKIEVLTTPIGRGQKLGIEGLEDRAAMLADVHARLMRMKRELATLTRTLVSTGLP